MGVTWCLQSTNNPYHNSNLWLTRSMPYHVSMRDSGRSCTVLTKHGELYLVFQLQQNFENPEVKCYVFASSWENQPNLVDFDWHQTLPANNMVKKLVKIGSTLDAIDTYRMCCIKIDKYHKLRPSYFVYHCFSGTWDTISCPCWKRWMEAGFLLWTCVSNLG